MRATILSSPASIMFEIEQAQVVLERREGRLVHVRANKTDRPWQFLDLGSDVGPRESSSRIDRRARNLLKDYGFGDPLIDLMVKDLMRDPWTVEEAA